MQRAGPDNNTSHPDRTPGGTGTPSGDGRRRRWDEHRRQRREELICAAIQALLEHGPDVDMAQVAAAARVSKPVLYRYFGDKAQLWLAVREYVARFIIDAVVPTVAEVRGERGRVRASVDAYLAAIETHPELYRFLMQQSEGSAGHSPLARVPENIAAELARAMGDRLRSVGLDSGPAEPWAHGLVGFVAAVGDWWIMRGRPMSREALTDYVATFLWRGFEGIGASADIPGGFLGGSADGGRHEEEPSRKH